MRKNFLLFLAVACMLCHLPAMAQTPSYATDYGTSGANAFPLNTSSGGNQRVQWLYVPGSFYIPTLAPSGTITDVYIHFTQQSGNYNYSDIEIALGYTNLTTWTGQTSFVSGLTVVYSVGPTTISTSPLGWAKFTLQVPFEFDNTKNLVMQLRTQQASGGLQVPQRGVMGRMWGTYAGAYVSQGTNLADFGFDIQPKKGMNNAKLDAFVSPVPSFCPGMQNVTVKVKNGGYNRINTVRIYWEVDGVLQPAVNYSGMIDTSGGSNPDFANISLGNVTFSGAARTLKAYTSIPNGIADTVNDNDTFQVVVSASPYAQITANGPTVFCTAGNINVTLDAPAGAGNIYQWFKDGNPIPGATNASLQATLAGDYTVRIDSNGCTNTSPIVRVDNLAMPLPLVHPNGYPVLCSGDSITLTANAGITGATYQWQFQGSDIPGATSASYTVVAPGNYTVVTSKYICNASSEGVNIVPATAPTPMIEEETASSYRLKTQPVYTSFQWKRDGNDIAGETSYVHIPKQNGSYTVVVSNGGCSAESQPVIVSSVSVKALSNSDITINIYPNPAGDYLNIDAPENAKLEITGVDGKVIMSSTIVTGKAIDISSLANGLYMMKIMDTDNNTLANEKLVKTAK